MSEVTDQLESLSNLIGNGLDSTLGRHVEDNAIKALEDCIRKVRHAEADASLVVRKLKNALWIAEQHTDSAVQRRLRDYHETVSNVREALQILELAQGKDDG